MKPYRLSRDFWLRGEGKRGTLKCTEVRKMAAELKVSLLGEMTLTLGENRVDETQNRSRKRSEEHTSELQSR